MLAPFIYRWLASSGHALRASAQRRHALLRRPTARLHLEPLEDRLAPANLTWSGANSELWSDRGNWLQGKTPYETPEADALLFPSAGARKVSNHDGPTTSIASVAFHQTGYTIRGGDLTLEQFGITNFNTLGANTFENRTLSISEAFTKVQSLPTSELVVRSSITGAGGFAVSGFASGTGKLTLLGNNSYAGKTQMQSGTLVVGSGSALGLGPLELWSGTTLTASSPVTLANSIDVIGPDPITVGGGSPMSLTGSVRISTHARLTVDGGDTWFRGVIFGPGSLTARSGTLRLSGVNTYEGGTEVNGGTVLVSTDSALGRGTLKLSGGRLAKDVPSTVTLANSFEVSGGTIHNFGQIPFTFAGSGTLLTGKTLTVFNNVFEGEGYPAEIIFTGSLTGSGSMRKIGAGVTTFSGTSANTYAGGTTVDGGTLTVNGSIGYVIVHDGATLAGTGVTGSATLNPGAVESPGGAAPGIQKVAQIGFSAGASYFVQLNGPNPGAGHDQLDVYFGSVYLNDGTLNASLGFNPVAGQRFVIIKNDGDDHVNGAFAGLPEGAVAWIGGVGFHVYYDGGDGNDVELTRNQPPTDVVPSSTSVAENQPSGTTVGTFSTIDPDASETFTYTLVSGDGDTDNAAFTIDASGNLKTAASFDFETKSSHSIRVHSRDAGGLSVDGVFTIDVINVNESPTVAVPGAQAAFEDVDKAISDLSVSDPDGDSLTVTLQVSHGGLILSSTAGLSVSGNGGGTVILAGSVSDLNAALAGLVYRGVLNFSGADALAITASDGSLSTTASVAIAVRSSAEQATDLQAQVNALHDEGVLNRGQANALNVKLNLKGNSGDVGKVQSFLHEVAALLSAGILTQAEADALLGPAGILLTSVSRR